MKCAFHLRAFSLTEILVAVGLFALAAVVLLGMLPTLARSVGESTDGLAAAGLSDAISEEMVRQAAEGGWEALVARLPVAGSPLTAGQRYSARRGGGVVQALDYLAPSGSAVIPEEGRYFLVEVWRFSAPPLGYAPGDAAVITMARVSWPYRVPGAGVVTPLTARRQITLALSLRR